MAEPDGPPVLHQGLLRIDAAIGAERCSNAHQTAADKVGEECSRVGLTSHVLEHGWGHQERVPLTKLMVAEIDQYYHTRNKFDFADEKQALQRLLEPGVFDEVNHKVLQSSLKDLRNRRKDLMRNKKKQSCAKALQGLREEPYTPPVPRHAIPQAEASTSGMSFEQAAKLKIKSAGLQAEVRGKNKEITNLVITQGHLERRVSEMKEKEEKHEKALMKRERKLEERERKVMEKEVQHSKVKSTVKNLSRKIHRRDQQIRKMKTGAKLLEKQLLKEAGLKEKLRKSLFYHSKSKKQKAKEEKATASMKEEKKQLKKRNAELLSQVFQLEVERDIASENQGIVLREGPNPTSLFSNDVRLCCMKLLANEVSAKNLSKVIHNVLTTLCNYNVSLKDLPGPTFLSMMRMEANLVSTIQIGEEMKMSRNMTLHSDGTSRDQVKYTDYELQTNNGLRLAGIITVPSGESQDQLDGFKFIMEKITRLTSDSETPESTTLEKQLISKIKNTMGDGAASQKHFNDLFQAYRKEVLPEVVEHWDELTPEMQTQLADMNHMYCQMHALIGFATYSDDALRELEDLWRKDGTKLGVEDLPEFQNKSGEYTWGRGDSATQRLVRTACDAVAPGGNQQAGCMGEFNTYLETIVNLQRSAHLKPFRGNRFNVLFQNAAGVWYHREHIQDMFKEGYHKAGNRLLRAVLADISSPPLLSGCRALGILYVNVTEPYYRLMLDQRVHILDLPTQLQHALTRIKEWSEDATPILTSDVPPLFHIKDEPLLPHKDKVYKSLYDTNEDEEMVQMTKDALQIMLANMTVVFERRFHALLHGKYKDDNSEERREEMKNMMKTNMRGENDFGYFSYLQTSKPSITPMALEGQAMFKMNETADWLDTLSATDPEKYNSILNSARKNRRRFQQMYAARQGDIKERKKVKMQQRAEKAREQEAKKVQLEEDRTELLHKYGGPVDNSDALDDFLESLSTTTKKTKLTAIKANITYLKLKRLNCPNELFKFSHKKEQHSYPQLTENLRTILSYPAVPAVSAPLLLPDAETPSPTLTREEMEDRLSRVRAAYARKANEARQSQEGDETADKGSNEGEGREETAVEKETEAEAVSQEGDETAVEEEPEAEAESEVEEESSSEPESDSEDSESEESSEDDESGEDEPPAKRARVENDEMYFKLDNFVAVAYEDSWYVGQVKEIHDEQSADVKFLQSRKTTRNEDAPTFFWPNRSTVENVELTFVIHSDVKIQPDKRTNSRTSEVCEASDINRLYNKYYNAYFAPKIGTKKSKRNR